MHILNIIISHSSHSTHSYCQILHTFLFHLLSYTSLPDEIVSVQSQINTSVGNQERLDKDRSYENSVINTNVGNQAMLDKDYYENSQKKDLAGPWEQRPMK